MQEKGIYYFHQGTNYYAYDLMGCHYTKEATTFRVWAPNAKHVSVVGEFNNWDTTRHSMKRISDGGIWEIVIKDLPEFTCYQYAINTHNNELIFKADPYAYHCELRPGRCSQVYNLNNYQFTDDEWVNSRKEKQALHQPLNIYELHLGSWKRYKDGNVFSYRKLGKEVAAYCKKMGYTHVEIMPVHEYPYDPSWGYQVTGFYSITARYGTPCDFMDFVNTLHKANIGVIVDWVPGHFAKDAHGLIDFDGGHLYEHPNPLRMEHKGWGTRCFDYGRNEIQSFLVSNAMFFVDKFHIDGLRVDAVASMLYLDYDRSEAAKNSFGGNENLEAIAFLQKTNKVLHEAFPGVLTIAEESTAFPGVTRSVEDGGLGFDYKWNMGWMNDTLSYIKTDPLYKGYDHNKITFQMTYIFSERYVLPLSHDEVVHGKGSLINKMPGDYYEKFCNLKTYLMYMMSHPGKKLLFMGGDIAQFREWSEARELDWSVLGFDAHANYQKYISKLNKAYKKYKVFYRDEQSWNGFEWVRADDAAANVFIYKRSSMDDKPIYVILNFAFIGWSNYKLTLPNGTYEVVLCTEDKEFGGSVEMNKKRYEVTNNELFIDIPKATGIYLRQIKTRK